jgi:2-dehydropantoate 2-reductase
MKVGILGAGAMGSMFGGFLSLAGHDVVLIDPWREHMESVAVDGLTIERPGLDAIIAHPRATADPSTVELQDAFVVLTKGYALGDAARSIQHAVGDRTLVVTLGNGLGNERVLGDVLGDSHVVPGTTTTGSEAVAPGRIRISQLTAKGEAITHVGAPRTADSLPPPVVEFAQVLSDAGLPTEAIENPDVVIWTKLAIAAVMGPLGGALRRTIADIWDNEDGRAIVRDMFDEVIAVGLAEGVPLERDELWEHLEQVLNNTNPNDYASMAIDILRGRPTEIDSFSMEVVRRADAHGLDAPISRTVGRMVKLLETPSGRTAPMSEAVAGS